LAPVCFSQWTKQNVPKATELIFGFELGNELNSCLNGLEGARTQAEDFLALDKMLDELWPAADIQGGQRPALIGPDTHSAAEFASSGQAWFGEFVKASAGKVPYFTFHEYSLGNGPELDPNHLDKSFLNAVALNKAGQGAATLQKIVRDNGNMKQQLWAGETAAANDGGQTGITDTYIDGFWYLDQLGAHAKYGVSVFQRQVLLSHGGYPMIEETKSGALDALPDYWLALVHKRTMGTGVLQTNSSSPTVRVYAHCATSKYAPGAVTLAVLNIGTASAHLTLDAAFAGSSREEFILTAGKPLSTAVNPLQSAEVLLNGQTKPLALQPGPSLPQINGKQVAGGEPLEIPPTSYGFVVFSGAEAAACRGGEARRDFAPPPLPAGQ
jgi:heparanase 1